MHIPTSFDINDYPSVSRLRLLGEIPDCLRRSKWETRELTAPQRPDTCDQQRSRRGPSGNGFSAVGKVDNSAPYRLPFSDNRSRSSCTSTINNSKRFSPMFHSRRAKRFDVSTNCPASVEAAFIALSVAVAGAPVRDHISNQCPDT
jgi:hypothetical protein